MAQGQSELDEPSDFGGTPVPVSMKNVKIANIKVVPIYATSTEAKLECVVFRPFDGPESVLKPTAQGWESATPLNGQGLRLSVPLELPCCPACGNVVIPGDEVTHLNAAMEQSARQFVQGLIEDVQKTSGITGRGKRKPRFLGYPRCPVTHTLGFLVDDL